jgi:hypothetical protein
MLALEMSEPETGPVSVAESCPEVSVAAIDPEVSDPLPAQAASISAAPSAGIILIVIEVPNLFATRNRRAAIASLQGNRGDLAAKSGRVMTKPRVSRVDSENSGA